MQYKMFTFDTYVALFVLDVEGDSLNHKYSLEVDDTISKVTNTAMELLLQSDSSSGESGNYFVVVKTNI